MPMPTAQARAIRPPRLQASRRANPPDIPIPPFEDPSGRPYARPACAKTRLAAFEPEDVRGVRLEPHVEPTRGDVVTVAFERLGTEDVLQRPGGAGERAPHPDEPVGERVAVVHDDEMRVPPPGEQ